MPDERAAIRRAIPAAACESRWLAGDGRPLRRIDWPAPASPHGPRRGSILFLPGRGDFYEKYLEAMAHWHGQGWAVTALDWRGQAGSGREGLDGLTGHIADFAIWVADLERFWGEWAATAPGPHLLIGHSMGGHLVLRALAEHRVRPAGAVLCAPMLGLHPTWLPLWLFRLVAAIMVRLGDPRRRAWDAGERPGAAADLRARLLTHDAGRYADELWWRKARPELTMGAGSWGWVDRALASIRGLGRPGVLEGVAPPVLVLATRADRLVSWPAIVRAVARLPDVELVAFGAEAGHELLREADPVRDAALAAIDRFGARWAEGSNSG